MKYIRTKDGVYLNGGRFGKPYAGIVGKKREIDFGFCFDKKDIIKQADTIEELCDGFIVEQKDNKDIWFFLENYGLKIMEKEELEYQLKDWNFNAFIKNEKGLIYVAKMNDKGELELL